MAKHRARIGYTSVAYVTEIFPRIFYQMVPEGVSLALLTQQAQSHADHEMTRIHDEARRAAKSFARAGADMVILGGVPTNLSRGHGTLADRLAELEREIGIPVSSSATAQSNALKALGARKVGVIHPSSPQRDGFHDAQIIGEGLEPAGTRSAGSRFEDYNRIPEDTAYALGCELKQAHPEADTLLFSCPHWAVTHAIEPLERELGVNVIASLQAIVWEGLRKCGIDDRIDGYGRLLREH